VISISCAARHEPVSQECMAAQTHLASQRAGMSNACEAQLRRCALYRARHTCNVWLTGGRSARPSVRIFLFVPSASHWLAMNRVVGHAQHARYPLRLATGDRRRSVCWARDSSTAPIKEATTDPERNPAGSRAQRPLALPEESKRTAPQSTDWIASTLTRRFGYAQSGSVFLPLSLKTLMTVRQQQGSMREAG
jgi:hypothetical protein